MNEGWIKLHAKFIKSAIFTSGDSYLVQLAMYCMMEANWKDKDVVVGNEVIKLKRGQFITGRKSLVKALTTIKKEYSKEFKKMEFLYRRKLIILEKLDFLHIKATNKYSIITIQNYSKYQDNTQQQHNDDTTTAQQLHTTKEDKNIRSKEYIYSSLKYLEEINDSDLEEFNKKYSASKSDIKALAEALRLWCETNNKKKKNYRAFLQNRLLDKYGLRPVVYKPEPVEDFIPVSEEKMAEFRKKKNALFGGV